MTAGLPVSPSVHGLKRECLSYGEVLAQSFAVLAPTTVPAAVMGLVYASSGNGTWLSFLLGMIGLVFVGMNINQFARRSASPGSLYSYIVKGLGAISGVLSGWGLILRLSVYRNVYAVWICHLWSKTFRRCWHSHAHLDVVCDRSCSGVVCSL